MDIELSSIVESIQVILSHFEFYVLVILYGIVGAGAKCYNCIPSKALLEFNQSLSFRSQDEQWVVMKFNL
jgi:hypothetical protein